MRRRCSSATARCRPTCAMSLTARRRPHRAVRQARATRSRRCRPAARCCSIRAASRSRSARRCPTRVRVVEAINPSTFAKSRKTADEAAHVRRAMEQDGAALAEFFAWFEDALAESRAGGARDHGTDDRRADHGRARAPPRLRVAELLDDRRLQRERRDAALPRDRAVACDDRRRRSAADRLGRPVHVRARPTSRASSRSARHRPSRSATSRWC